MILSGQTIRQLALNADAPMITPFNERTRFEGMTFGLGPSGYDVRIRQRMVLRAQSFELASIVEHLHMPNDILATVNDKSSWARRGLSLFNTVIEPGWRGWLTIELTNTSLYPIIIPEGAPIAQILFQRLDAPAETPYDGKYQDQPDRPVAAIREVGP